MLMRHHIIAVGAVATAALVTFGVWLGRSSSATPDPPSVAPSMASSSLPQPPAPRARGSTPLAPATHRTMAAAPGLAADLVDVDPKIRRAAVREVIRDDAADPATLLAASRDADLEVGVIATEALGKLHARGQVAARELIDRATDRKLDERVRVSALNGLGLVPSTEAERLLADLAARGDVGERRGAAILLVHQDPGGAIPTLIALLGDADEYVRSNALESLRARSRGRDFGTDAGAWRAWWQSRSR